MVIALWLIIKIPKWGFIEQQNPCMEEVFGRDSVIGVSFFIVLPDTPSLNHYMFLQSTKSTHFKLQMKHVMFTYPFNYTIKTSLKK